MFLPHHHGSSLYCVVEKRSISAVTGTTDNDSNDTEEPPTSKSCIRSSIDSTTTNACTTNTTTTTCPTNTITSTCGCTSEPRNKKRGITSSAATAVWIDEVENSSEVFV